MWLDVFSVFEQFLFQELSGVGRCAGSHFFRRSSYDKATSFVSSFRSEVDDIVGTLDDIHVVLDDDNRVSPVDECFESLKQFLDVVEMQSCCRLVEDEDGG